MNIRVHVQGIVGLICGLALLGGLVSAQNGEAKTYYVATDGSDSNPGTEAQPFSTLDAGVRTLGAGDTLYVKNGEYTAKFISYHLASGTSWDNPVTIAAYPGHSPVIVREPQEGAALYLVNTRYIVIDGFVIDGANGGDAVKITYDSSAANHIRIQNCEILNAEAGIEVTPGSDGNEFIHLDVHDIGPTDFNHGIYIASSDNLVEDCSVHDNTGWGVEVFRGSLSGVDNNIIRNNILFNNGRSGTRGNGITLSSGSGNQAYGNDIWGNIGGIAISYGASNTYVARNTIHGNPDYGIFIREGTINTLVESNFIYDTHDNRAILNEGILTSILP